MANENLGASFSIDVTQLKSGLAQANRLIRESESEFREAAAGMDDWTSSQEGLEARQKTLNKQIDIQQEKVSALTAEKKRIIAEMEKEGKSAEEIAKATDAVNQAISKESKQLDKLKSELSKTEKAMDKLSNETEDAEKQVDDLGDAAKDAGKKTDDMGDAAEDSGGKLEGLKKAGGIAVGAIAAVAGACVGAVGAFLGLAESTRESRNEMAKMETSFETAGLSAENAEKTFTDLYGIMGDEGAAVEAAQQLAKISKDEKDLSANTKILTGVMAEYGNSIPLEGLAEGIAATSAMKSVQGPLADALEWQGVNLDDVNAKLESLATEEERTAYIQETLLGLYGESAEAYMKNNEQIIEANKAQANLNDSLNELGEIAEPIMTTLKNLAADLLKTITPFVELIGEGLSGALNGTEGAAEKLASGISGLLETAISKITEMLPFAIDTIISIIPQLLTAILSKAPEVLQALLGMVETILEDLLPVILGMLPDILSTVGDMVVMVVEKLYSMLPSIATSISNALPAILNAILALIPMLMQAWISAIPQVLQAAITLLMAIVQAIPVIVQSLMAALPSVINSLISALVSSIPLLLDASLQLLMAIVDAIPLLLDVLIENLPLIIDSIITGVLEALPLLLDAAIQLFFAILDAIPVIVQSLSSKMPEIIGVILSSISEAIPELFKTAKDLLGQIGEAVGNLVKELPGKMGEVITSMVQGLEDGIEKIKDIGGDIIRGLWDGINDMTSWIGEKIKGFGENVLGGIKDFFGIKSPSRVMADVVGKNLALGIGEGFEDNIGEVNKDIQNAFNLKPVPVQFSANGVTGGLASGSQGGVVVNQYNTYSQAHSRYEIWQSQQDTVSAVKLALIGG